AAQGARVGVLDAGNLVTPVHMRVDMNNVERAEPGEGADIRKGDGVVASDQNREGVLVENGLDARGHLAAVVFEIVVSNVDIAAIDHPQAFEEAFALVDIPIAARRVAAPS